MTLRATATTGLLLTMLAVAADARAEALVAPSLAAMPRNGDPITIDGLLAEDFWARCPLGGDFVQLAPHELAPATETTTVQVGFDDANLYVAVTAHDREPEAIRDGLARRDTEPPSDWIRVSIDSYADRRTAFEFSVNPSGVKLDDRISGDGIRDFTWDAVWDVEARRTADGWVAEFRIPLSELRFSSSATADWGLQVRRVIARKNEVSVWAPTLQSDPRAVTRFGMLTGLRSLATKRSIQLIPYASAGASRPSSSRVVGTAGRTGFELKAGGDVKARIASNYTLDVTLNPDFGQVEADPSVMNLSAFETYYTEQRPFFVEGSDILRFPIGIGNGDLGSNTLYYSRRVGAVPPLYDLDTRDAVDVSLPTSTNIYGATKLSGKSARGTSLALLEAVTGEARARLRLPASIDPRTGESVPERTVSELVAPRTNYFVGRAQQDWRDGHTTLGLMTTSVVRDDAHGDNVTPAPLYATTAGLDVSHRSMDDQWLLSATLSGSDVRGSREAIALVQQAPARYFQRPDNRGATFDPERKSLRGYAATLEAGRPGGKTWRYSLYGLVRSPGFEANDLGYVPNADWRLGVFWLGYRDLAPGRVLRSTSIDTNWIAGRNFGGDVTDLGAAVSGDVQLLNYWGVYAGLYAAPTVLNTTQLRGGPAVKAEAYSNAWLGIYSDARAPLFGEIYAEYGGRRRGAYWYLQPRGVLRPSPRLSISVQLSYKHSVVDAQHVDTVVTDAGAPTEASHYVIGRLAYDTWSLITRFDLTLTPELTVQLYAQPFVSGGHFGDAHFREVVDGRASRYEDRFAPFTYEDNADFSLRQFRSTMVVRWEYHPGATLFFVWSQNRTSEDAPGRVQLNSDLARLFSTAGETVILCKLSYWFGE